MANLPSSRFVYFVESMPELVDVVNEFDEVIGTADKFDVYKKGLSNRIVHVFVVHPETGDIFIQKRGPLLRYLPDFYCTSAGGHVGAGESYEAAAGRELEEELGLTGELQLVEKFIYTCPETNPPTKRFISLYIHYAKDEISYSDGEVADGFFAPIEELVDLIKKGDKIHPQLPACFDRYLSSVS